ncbi:alpha beta hydrolase family domain-containing [Fusarium albosuccineum]|uniref:Alpha beta hydrolase family domain-containing n=1 Tax=Fusarium albosuccineum TaxID=1237068 RepID=A0A8H4LLW3_9HYPO|nr:alpha beta hydrolase family domain-containing [Fusarium albosuccineum]
MLPTIVGVPGMWHPASSFDDLAANFQKRGYTFVSQDAPGILLEDSFTATAEVDAESLRQNLPLPLLAQGRHLILLTHSYGGVYGSAAVSGLSKQERSRQGLEGGVIGLVYVTAVPPVTGKSLMDILGLALDSLPPHVVYEKSTARVLFVNPDKHMYHGITDADIDKWISKIRPQAFKSIDTPISYSPLTDSDYKDQVAYIICGKDRILSLDAQKLLCELVGITETVVLPEASHHAFFVEAAEETVEATISFLERFVRKVL